MRYTSISIFVPIFGIYIPKLVKFKKFGCAISFISCIVNLGSKSTVIAICTHYLMLEKSCYWILFLFILFEYELWMSCYSMKTV